MTWGTFRTEAGIHVAPCTAQGQLLADHLLASVCPCRPTPEWQPGWRQTLWHHHDNH